MSGRAGLANTRYKVCSSEMRISLQHTKLLVTRDSADLDHIQTLLKKPGNGLVAEIMEVEVY
jgi:hypothetical protein